MAITSSHPNADTLRHPNQPLALDANGVLRFKSNAICRHLIDNGSIDLNMLAMGGFSKEDHAQFAQLIGYSQSGWGSLSYVDDLTFETVATMHEDPEANQKDVEIAVLKAKLEDIQTRLRDLCENVLDGEF